MPFGRRNARAQPLLQIDRDLDEPHRELTRAVLSALAGFGEQGATRAQIETQLEHEPQAQLLVPMVLAEALHDDVVQLSSTALRPSDPDAQWVLKPSVAATLQTG